MASWVLKAIAQRVIGALPYRELWNEFFQEWVTHSLRLDEPTIRIALFRRRCFFFIDLAAICGLVGQQRRWRMLY